LFAVHSEPVASHGYVWWHSVTVVAAIRIMSFDSIKLEPKHNEK
jgi:hypothetical protein